MTTSNKDRLQLLIIGEYSEILNKVRRGVKGLRIGYLKPITVIGKMDGARLCEITEQMRLQKNDCYQRLARGISAGLISKVNKRYYLTDKGQQVYDTICREFDASMEEIIRVLVEEAIKRT